MTLSTRPLREPPIAFQILGLLLGGLIVAQFVTLLLTMIWPPAPPSQYDMRDIVAALQGQQKAGRLSRVVQAAPPDVGGTGWFTSADSRDVLAQMLRLPPADVRLAFYAPLPFAGVSIRPAHATLTHHVDSAASASQGTAQTRLEGGVQARAQDVAWSVDPQPLRPQPISATLLTLVAAPGPGAPFPGPAFPGTVMPGNGGLADQGSRGFPARGQTPGNDRARGGSPASGFAGAGAIDRDLHSAAPAPSPGDLASQPVAAPGGGGASGERSPGASSHMPDARTAPSAAPGPRPVAPDRDIPLPTLLLPGTAARATPAPTPDDGLTMRPAPAPHSPATTERQPVRAAPPSAAPPAPARSEVTQLPHSAPSIAPGDAATGRSQPIQPRARALFGLAPSPFVEGDFVAAIRLPDGRWTVVQPAAEAFPNAWQRRILLWFAIAFALAAPIGWLYARHIVRPIERFTTAAEKLGCDPAADPVALDGPAEIGRAAHAFNVMQSRLRSFVDDRTTMVGAISHDLRTPLTRLRFRIEEVDDDDIRDGMIGEVAEMEAMIASVLSFIRDASTPNVREKLDLSLLVEDVAQDAAMIGNDVTVDVLAPAPVEIDVLGVRRLFANLIENAVKYGDRAHIRMRIEEDAAIAEVRDDGPGIPASEMERAFEPFYRASNARGSDKTGTGLGLAVCRSIARAHGGDVVLVQSPEGFSAQLRLPLAYNTARLAA